MNKRGIVLYLHAHQPYRIRKYSVFDMSSKHDYFESPINQPDQSNELIFKKVANKSYRPMNIVLERLMEKYPDFKISLSITGVFLEQAEKWAPDVISSFKRLVDTGRVEIMSETYHHSLAFFYSRPEFERQVELHRRKIREVFGVETSIFRNTELAYNDELAKWAEGYGFKGILAEGWDPILEWRSPNHVYRPIGTEKIALLVKNYRLSDDIAFRFSDQGWSGWPLSADTYTGWMDSSISDQPIANLFMDYETFGEHQWVDTGIFDFFEDFVGKWLIDEKNTFYTVSGAINSFPPVGELSMPNTISWADSERDLSAWTGNSMQREVLKNVYAIEDEVLATNNEEIIGDWRNLQISDHSYYLCTKWFKDGDVHAYFSPYKSPYDAFIYYINAIRDLKMRAELINRGLK